MSKKYKGIYTDANKKDIHFNMKIVSDRFKDFSLSIYLIHSNNFIKIVNE